MKSVWLTFDRDHTDAGQPIKRGDVRKVASDAATWLIAQNIAHATPAATRGRMDRTEPTHDTTITEEQDHVTD